MKLRRNGTRNTEKRNTEKRRKGEKEYGGQAESSAGARVWVTVCKRSAAYGQEAAGRLKATYETKGEMEKRKKKRN